MCLSNKPSQFYSNLCYDLDRRNKWTPHQSHQGWVRREGGEFLYRSDFISLAPFSSIYPAWVLFLLPLPPLCPPPLIPLSPPFIADGGEISVLFTQKIRAELGRRRLFCDDGDKIGDGVCVCVCMCVRESRATPPYLGSRRSSHMKLFIVITHGKSRFRREI